MVEVYGSTRPVHFRSLSSRFRIRFGDSSELSLSAEDLDNIKRAAPWHDVGKIYEEFAPLLRKGRKLNVEEIDDQCGHTSSGARSW